MNVLNKDDPPVAEDLSITVYSGRTTNFSLPAYDPDGNPVELYIITEPQSGSGGITMTSESVVSVGSLRRKVCMHFGAADYLLRPRSLLCLNLWRIDIIGLVLQGLNPVSFYAPDELIPDYGVTFRYTNRRRVEMFSFFFCMHEFLFLFVPLMKYDCSYIARDPVGNQKSREAWVYMLVRSPKYWSEIQQNTAPVALDGSLQTMQGLNVQSTLNATDDFDTPEQMVFTVLEPPANGKVTLQGNAVDYMPNPGFYGEDAFVFQVILVPSLQTLSCPEEAGSRSGLSALISACLHTLLCHQVSDGMGLASNNGTVKITVIQINEPPRLVCENGNSGLFSSPDLLAMLQAISRGEATATNATAALLLEESETAAASDQLPLSLRTQALQRLAKLASDGAIVFGPSASTLSCSATGTTRVGMASDFSTESVDIALLAFDFDEEIGTTYTLLDIPPMGNLYVTTALPGALYPQVCYAADAGKLSSADVLLTFLYTGWHMGREQSAGRSSSRATTNLPVLVLEFLTTLVMHDVLQASNRLFLEIGGDFRQVNTNLSGWQVPHAISGFLWLVSLLRETA